MRRVLTWVVLLMAAPGVFAADRTAVVALLSGYEWELRGNAFAALGPDAYRTLLAIAVDEAVDGVTRARASAALSLYPNDEVWAFYHARLDAPESNAARRRTVEALCAAFGHSRRAALESVLLPLLDTPDAHLRTQVARCLGPLASPVAADALERYRSRIRDAWERRAAGFVADP